MKITEKEQRVQVLAAEIAAVCAELQACRAEVEGVEEEGRLRGCLDGLCREGMQAVRGVGDMPLLLALLDAYEVIRDEGMLQRLLDMVSRGLGQLEVSADSVRLLSYCYYYTEDEECALLARKMLYELEDEGSDLADVVEVFRDLVGEC